MKIRKIFMLIAMLSNLIFLSDALAELYKVNVKRIDQDLYKTDSSLIIKTRYCYEYTYGEEAVLKYEEYSYDNKLIFDSGTICEVDKVIK